MRVTLITIQDNEILLLKNQMLELNRSYQLVPDTLLPIRWYCILKRYLKGMVRNTYMTIYGSFSQRGRYKTGGRLKMVEKRLFMGMC